MDSGQDNSLNSRYGSVFGELHSEINPALMYVNTYCVWQARAGSDL